MAITLDSSASGTGSASPVTFSHTLGSGSDRLVVVAVAVESDAVSPIITTVTYGGVTMTELTSVETGSGFINYAGLWILLDSALPAAGSNTVSITLPAGADSADVTISGCTSWDGVEQATPSGAQLDTSTGASTTTVTVTPTTDGANSLVIGCSSSGIATTFTPPGSYTERFDSQSGSATGTSFDDIESTGSTLLSLTSTSASSSNRFAVASASFNEATASVTAAITGTMTTSADEDEITSGGNTVIITLTGDTFKAAGTGPIGSTADTQALIDGFDAASSPTNGWNNEVRDKAATTEVVRTSSTVATWTVAAQAGYDISSQETITGTIPTACLVTGAGAITATPTFTIDPVSGISIPVIVHHFNQLR